jgi:hypothetical protein
VRLRGGVFEFCGYINCNGFFFKKKIVFFFFLNLILVFCELFDYRV